MNRLSLGGLLVVLSLCATSGHAAQADVYRIQIDVDPAKSQFEGRMTLSYHNLTTEPLTEVRLRLDLNLFADQALTVRSVGDGEGRQLRWSYRPFKFAAKASESGQLSVPLPKPLKQGEAAELQVEFECRGKFIGQEMITLQDAPFTNLDAWYPKAMTMREGAWSMDDDRPSSYSVVMELPDIFVVASTGQATRENPLAGGRKTVRLEAAGVRGFAIYAAAALKEQRMKAEGVELKVLLPQEAWDLAQPLLEAAADAIGFYQRTYGPYPSRHLDIICVGKMSDPAHGSSAACNTVVIWLGGQLKEQYRFLIAHEVAHQYFGSLVGMPRNEIGWAAMGLGMSMDHNYMVRKGLDDRALRRTILWFYFEALRRGYDTSLVQPVEELMMSPPPWSFGWNMSLMHGKAYAVCAMLEDVIGKDKFQAVIRKVIRERAGGLLSGADLLRYCEAELGSSLDWFAADWIRGTATLDYAITDVKPIGDGWDISIARLGAAGYPVTVEAVTEKGEKLRQRVDRKATAASLHFATASQLREVVIDPDQVVPDVNEANNRWPNKTQKKF